MTNVGLLKVYSTWSILQYFRPLLSENWSLKPIFGIFEWPPYTGFTVSKCMRYKSHKCVNHAFIFLQIIPIFVLKESEM